MSEPIDRWKQGVGVTPDADDATLAAWRRRRHALRQPINALSLYCETLRLKLQGSGHESLIALIQEAASAIESMADELCQQAEDQVRHRAPQGSQAAVAMDGWSRMAPAPQETPAEEFPLSGVSVIVVDDDPAARLGVQLLLETWGAEVRVLAGLGEIEAFLATGSGAAPDLVMIDYHLPRPGQGLDALNRLRQHWQADLAAVLVTGDDRAALSNALLDGRMACLVKPVSPQPLLAALQRQLGR